MFLKSHNDYDIVGCDRLLETNQRARAIAESGKARTLHVTPLPTGEAALETTTHPPCQPKKCTTAAGKQEERHKRKGDEIMS